MQWTDDAVLLSVRKLNNSKLLLEVMSARHGWLRAVSPIDVKRFPMLLPGCFLKFECRREEFDKPALASLLEADAGIIASDVDDVGLMVLSGARQLILQSLVAEDPAPDLHQALSKLLESLVTEDGRWPIHYAKFEFSIALTLDLVSDIESCRSDFRHGEAIYFSPRTSKAVTRERVGAFLDKVIPLPGILMGARNGSPVDVRQALDLTGRLLTGYLERSEKAAEFETIRRDVVAAASAVTDIPQHQETGNFRTTLAARRARMLSERPLMVSKRSGTSAG